MLFTLSGVTGAGKSTFIKRVLKKYPKSTGVIRTRTTQPLNLHHQSYQLTHMSEEEFAENRRQNNFFITATHYDGIQHGILTSDIESAMSQTSIFYCIVEVLEIESLISFASNRWPHSPVYTKIQSIHIRSPHREVLRKRLHQKYGDTFDADAIIMKERGFDSLAHQYFLDNRHVHFIENESTLEALDTAILNLEFD